MRSIVHMLLLLGAYFGISMFAGMKWALLAFSLFLMIIGTVFIIKKDSYLKYIKFVNPEYALLYNTKDDTFRRKHRITDIIAYFVISAIMLILSIFIPNTTLSLPANYLVFLILGTVLFSILLWFVSLIILKKSRKNSTFWFYFIGAILTVILALGIIENFL